ncbi:hypothetical protein [Streptomyces sp. sk226]|uniref:hypothetical protein n=1 Tax=Streptomyces sp. sk226 TaxID=2034268 RepID=UPI0011860452|nr:hypothetical protein [Streptomyces sp. sk226]
MDASVQESIRKKVGHEAPFETTELTAITSININAAHSLEGLESLHALRILIMNGCNVPSIGRPLQDMRSLVAVISHNSALCDISGLSELQLDRMDLQRNRIEDLTPLLAQANLMEVNVTGNPLNRHSYRSVIPELMDRGCRVIHSGETEWALGLRMSEEGIPFSYYESAEGYRLCRPGLRFTSVPELNHPIIPPEELDALLTENPSAVASLFEK